MSQTTGAIEVLVIDQGFHLNTESLSGRVLNTSPMGSLFVLSSGYVVLTTAIGSLSTSHRINKKLIAHTYSAIERENAKRGTNARDFDYGHHLTPRRQSYAHYLSLFSETPCSSVHHIGVFVFLVILDYGRLLTAHLFATHGTSSFAAQPGSDALEVKLMSALAGKLNDEAVRIVQVGNLADGAVLITGNLLAVHAVEAVQELLRDALQPGRGVVDVVLEGGDETLEEPGVVGRGRRGVQRRELVLQQAEEGGRVDGRGRRVRVLLGRLVAGGLAELVEEGEEGGHVYAAAGAAGFGKLDIVFDCGL